MPVREYVDFSLVEEAHREIDARLANWARWSRSRLDAGALPRTCPGFNLYRSSSLWDGRYPVDIVQVDKMDAQRMQKAVSALPQPHRLALSWCYIKRSNPRRAAADLGQTLEGLMRLIVDGRQMLISRGV